MFPFVFEDNMEECFLSQAKEQAKTQSVSQIESKEFSITH